MAAGVGEVWQALEPQLDWENPHLFVSYAQIKAVGGEPRLAAKFDNSGKLPEVLKRHDRFIMPTDKGYLLHKGIAHGYESIPSQACGPVSLPCDPRNLFTFGPSISEHSHLHFALRQRVFHHFLGVQGSLWESWSSRRHIHPTHYTVGGGASFPVPSSTQIEVDLGLTLGYQRLALIEGKSGGAKDFHVRQLFLPYLDAKSQLPKTPVSTLFFEVIDFGHYIVREYTFSGTNDITVRDHARSIEYRLVQPNGRLVTPTLSSDTVSESTIDIPQANTVELILETVRAVGRGARKSKKIARKIGVDDRQGQYYAHAARILGLLEHEPETGHWYLTRDGQGICLMSAQSAEAEMESRISRLHIVRMYRNAGPEAVLSALQGIGFSESTAGRRLGTVKKWSDWRPRDAKTTSFGLVWTRPPAA